MPITINGAGTVTGINAGGLPDDCITTADIAAGAVTQAKRSEQLTLGTAVAITSGTSLDFTGIPSWVKRVTVMFAGVSTSGTSIVQIQLGSTSFSTSGYKSTASFSGSGTGFAQATSGFITDTSFATASLTRAGLYIFSLIGSNTWVGSGNIGGDATAVVTWACAGNSPALSGALDRVRITTVNGTDTFDAGTINIMYE
jgi:hypothetical protein